MLSQAITALSFGFTCDLFLLDSGVKLAVKGYIDTFATKGYASLPELLKDFHEIGGTMYVCHPSSDSRGLTPDDFLPIVTEFVNASKLVALSKEAQAVFTY